MTGEIADGWLGTSFMPEHARRLLRPPRRRRGARRPLAGPARPAGRRPRGLRRRRRAAASPPRKPGLAFTLGAMGSRQHNFYNDAFRRAGYADAAVEVQRLWLDGKRDEAAARVPDELVDQDEPARHRGDGPRALAAYRRAGITTLRSSPAAAGPGGPAGHPGPADGDRESGLRCASIVLPPWGAAFVGRRRLASAASLRV